MEPVKCAEIECQNVRFAEKPSKEEFSFIRKHFVRNNLKIEFSSYPNEEFCLTRDGKCSKFELLSGKLSKEELSCLKQILFEIEISLVSERRFFVIGAYPFFAIQTFFRNQISNPHLEPFNFKVKLSRFPNCKMRAHKKSFRVIATKHSIFSIYNLLS